jgi:phosphoglucomutase
MTLSPSGWRGVFSAGGDEENPGEEPAPVYCCIAAAAAAVFADYVANLPKHRPQPCECTAKPVIILGRDTRPTGRIIADMMIRSFLASGCTVRFAGIAAAPEIMAHARTAFNAAPDSPKGLPLGAFCYISASHNPIGHNGFKFGLDDGGVLEGSEAAGLIEAFKNYIAQPDPIGRIRFLLEKAGEDAVRQVYAESEKVKQESLEAYFSFCRKVIAGEGAETVMQAITEGLKNFPLGIAVDFNGSARAVSIDAELCRSLGLGFRGINGNPGEIAHAIIPEGDSLESCRRFLEELHAKDNSFVLGYMPDCDGDRGNLVIWDDGKNAARILEAQEVFALACMAELAQLVWTGELPPPDAPQTALPPKDAPKAAVVVNDATSRRIDRIANAFGAAVFRAEVGEANVVNLARKLRKEGYMARILGEGSNGGNITHPSSVRDPLATVFAMVKLLTIQSGRAGNGGKGLFEIWESLKTSVFRDLPLKWKDAAQKAGINPVKPEAAANILRDAEQTLTLAAIIDSLPPFYTTGVSAPEAKLQVTTSDHALLKDRYQKIFEKEWNEKKEQLKLRWGITGWEACACNGTMELRNLSRFGGAKSGGLKIVFTSAGCETAGCKGSEAEKAKNETAFIWLRGSKTEPVFRIMADAEDPALERELIAWQRAMTAAADTGN